MQHANPAQFVAEPTPRHAAAPEFDPNHPDAEILEAYAGIRASRVKEHAEDDGGAAGAARGPDHADAELDLEGVVTENWATTPAGIAAGLLLAIPAIEQQRWVDRALAEHGILALYNVRSELDFASCSVIAAAYELLHLEWETVVTEYERSAAAADAALNLQRLLGAEMHGLAGVGLKASDALVDLATRICADQLKAQTSAAECVTRLVRTLAPDLATYRRKIEVIELEGVQTEAVPWLARDAQFLFARIDPPARQSAAEQSNV